MLSRAPLLLVSGVVLLGLTTGCTGLTKPADISITAEPAAAAAPQPGAAQAPSPQPARAPAPADPAPGCGE